MRHSAGVVATLALTAALSWSQAAQAGATCHVGNQGYQALPSLFWQELETAREEGEKVVVIFTADWCAPCKMMAPMFEAAAVDWEGLP